MYRSNILIESLPIETKVLIACFSTGGNSELVTDVLKLECKKLATMSAFFLIILEGKLVS